VITSATYELKGLSVRKGKRKNPLTQSIPQFDHTSACTTAQIATSKKIATKPFMFQNANGVLEKVCFAFYFHT
jgi:hypothetical protein